MLRRLFGSQDTGDGGSPLLEQQAVASITVLPGQPTRRRALAHPPARLIQEQLATKLLHAWLQNRHQTLFPLSLNLGNLDPAQRALLVQSMAVSAVMTGGVRLPLASYLPSIGGGHDDAAALQAALDAPPLPADLLPALQRAGLGAHAYTVALLVTAGAAGRLGTAWTAYLAAWFDLPAEVTRDLQRRGGRRLRRGPRSSR